MQDIHLGQVPLWSVCIGMKELYGDNGFFSASLTMTTCLPVVGSPCRRVVVPIWMVLARLLAKVQLAG